MTLGADGTVMTVSYTHLFPGGFRARLFSFPSGIQLLGFQIDHAQDVGCSNAAA